MALFTQNSVDIPPNEAESKLTAPKVKSAKPSDMKHLLTDEQYAQYLSDGILVIQPESLDDAFHDHLYRSAQQIYALVENSRSKTAHLDIIGDSLRARIPEIDRLFEDPLVSGALRSVLGDDYVIHPHNFVHKSSDADQVFHQDGNLPWNERGHYRAHRPDWALLFYYPQDVTAENGPTEVILGTQYWTRDFEKTDGTWHSFDGIDRAFTREELANEDLGFRDRRLDESVASLGIPDLQRKSVTVPKGSVVLCHYDILHRGSRKFLGAADRFMYTFHFMRTQEPTSAAWQHRPGFDEKKYMQKLLPQVQPIVRNIWDWSGNFESAASASASLVELKQSLFSGDETKRVEAAYLLGAMQSDESADLLLEGLTHPEESVRRASCYGLKISGAAQANKILPFVGNQRVSIRRLAVYALGESTNGLNAQVVEVVLAALIKDQDDLVRSNAAYAMGQILRCKDADFSVVIDALIQRLAPGVEPNNTSVALFPRSTVRQSIAYSLLQAACNHEFSAEQIEKLLALTLEDDDRYVQGFAIEITRQNQNLSSKSLGVLLAALSRLRLSPRPAELNSAS